MDSIQFQPLNTIAPQKLLPILNKTSTRKHLIKHDVFDESLVRQWINAKMAEDAKAGCLVRAILKDETLIGWCGIQQSELGHEIAIVLDDSCWGVGKTVFKQLMIWCHDFQHHTVYIHLLHTRPSYRFLEMLAQRTFETNMMGDKFTTYELNVEKVVRRALE